MIKRNKILTRGESTFITNGNIYKTFYTRLAPRHPGYPTEDPKEIDKLQKELAKKFQDGDEKAGEILLKDYYHLLRMFHSLLVGPGSYIKFTNVSRKFLAMMMSDPTTRGNLVGESKIRYACVDKTIGILENIRKQVSRLTPEELWQEILQIFFNRIKVYEERNVPFCAYMAQYMSFDIKYMVLKMIKSADNYLIDLYDVADDLEASSYSLEFTEDTSDDLDGILFYIQYLTPLEKQILYLTINEDYHVKDIAEMLQISEYSAGKIGREAKAKLKEYYIASGTFI